MADEIIVRIRAEGQEKFIKDLKKSGIAVERVGDQSDKTTKKITKNRKTVEKANERLAKSYKRLGVAIAAAFSVAAISRFIKQSVKAADIQLKAETKLLTALKGRTDVQQRLIKQAQDLQKQTLFGDEATINAQALLASLGLNEDAITRLIPLIQDLATKSGQDLSTTADLVAKSVGSSTNALSRYGVVIEGAVGSSERLESAITNLNKQVGGQAVAAAETGSGGITKLQNAVGDLQEEVGKAILEGLTPFAEVLQEIAENKEVIDFFKSFGNFIGNTLNLIGKSISGWNKLFKALDGGKSARKALSEQTFDQILLQRQAAKEALDEAKANKESTTTVLKLQNEYRKFNNEFQRRISAGRDRSKQQQSFIDLTKEEIETVRELTASEKKLIDEYSKAKDITAEYSLEVLALAQAWQRQLALDKEIERLFKASLKATEILGTDEGSLLNILKQLQAEFTTTKTAVDEFYDSLVGDNALVISETTQTLVDGYRKSADAAKSARVEEQDAAEQAKKAEQERIQLQNERIDTSLSAIGSIGQAQGQLFETFKGFQQAELAELDKRYAQGLISEKQYQEQRSEILKKQAKADKAAAIFQAVINTAAGIAKAIPNLPLIALAASIGAAQLATIAAQPIPQFAEGTRGRKRAPKGWAWVGEEGPELVQMRGGEKVVTADDSQELMKLLGGYGIPVQFKNTYEELSRPIQAIASLKSKDSTLDWNPLLRSNDMSRRSAGVKLDRIYEEMVRLNSNISRKMTRS